MFRKEAARVKRHYYAERRLPERNQAAIAQLGERQTEDLKVPGSTPGLGIFRFMPCGRACFCFCFIAAPRIYSCDLCIISRGVANGRKFISPTQFVLRAFVRAASAVVFRSFRAADVRKFM